MNKIEGRRRSIEELLSGTKYALEYYQREYEWKTKHVAELLEDLEGKFSSIYKTGDEPEKVEQYSHYFLGSIIINEKNGGKFIIDGQQRLTTLTLLLIYLHNLQQGRSDEVDVNSLIFSEKHRRKSFNLDVPERKAVFDAFYGGQSFDASDKPPSVQNIAARYADIEKLFPEMLKGEALPFFVDWLKGNVDIIEITAYTDDDAYTIFETMNDRGLSLSPTDMLKGYLLANIYDHDEKASANELWKQRILELVEVGKEEKVDFFKAWLRAKYADSIRDRKKDAANKDFEKIGTSFHKWVRDEKKRIGLDPNKSSDFREFVENRFAQFSKHYIRVREASQKLTPGLEYVFYNAYNGFTLQYPLMLAPLRSEDDQDTVDRKVRLVAGYLDIFIARRIVNFRTLGYSSIVYTMFNLMKEIRDLDVPSLAQLLKTKASEMSETFFSDGVAEFRLHQQNKYYVHYLLARITHHIDQQSGVESSFETYVSREIQKPFEIEHIWADHYEQYTDEFETPQTFAEYRNRLGGLLLLPHGFNQSLGDDAYEKKVKAYFGQNLLAKSLNEQCYQNNPSFLSYLKRSGFPFRPHPKEFKKVDLDERQDLYLQICEEIWSPALFDRELS